MINIHSKREEYLLREKAEIVFLELSSGVYDLQKDRYSYLGDSTINGSSVVAGLLSGKEKVLVIGLCKTYSNFGDDVQYKESFKPLQPMPPLQVVEPLYKKNKVLCVQ